MTFTVFTMRGSSGARSPKRTNASASRLTIERRRPGRLIRRTVLDRHEAVARRRGVGLIRLGDADVVPVDAVLLRQFACRSTYSHRSMLAFQASAVSRRYVGGRRVRRRVGQIGGDQQRGDLGGDGERRIARLLLPAILRAHGTVAREKRGRAPHHRPERVALAGVDHAFASGEIDQQNRQGRFVHLDAVPVRRAVEPHVLRPVAVRLLRDLQVSQHAPRVRGARRSARKPPAVSTRSRGHTR